jgi:hypothetical protein
MKGAPGSVVGGPKLVGESPIKPKAQKRQKRESEFDDDELSALSKQFRQFLPVEQAKGLA